MVKKVSKISKSGNNMRPVAKQSYSMGFTLIELMIVVAVIAILATIAYPSYLDSVRKARRADVQQGLMEAAHKLENFYARNATYTTDLTQVGYTNAEWNDVAAGSNTVWYQIRVVPPVVGTCELVNCFVLESQSLGDQVNDPVSKFTLGSTGKKERIINGVPKNGWK